MGREDSGQLPRVGIFWQVQNQLVTSMAPLDEAEACEGRYDIADDHYSFWEKWASSRRPDLSGFSYDHFPRGRVIYNSDTDVYMAYADRCLLSQKGFDKKIRRAFNLCGLSLILKNDAHYQCHRCNPSFIPDLDCDFE